MDPNLSIEERVEDLISQMTLEEKVGQMKARWAWSKRLFPKLFEGLPPEMVGKVQTALFISLFGRNGVSDQETTEVIARNLWRGSWKEIVVEGSETKHAVGALSCSLRYFSPSVGANLNNEIQRFLKDNTRLWIPVIHHDEALHGCVAKGSTSFPQAIALAATWNPELVEEVASTIGKESRARGIHQVLSPTINIARDARCGRTQETYGEDPFLTSRTAVAFVKGVQEQRVAATVKHFAANFVADGGRDSGAVHLSERILREVYFPAFKAAVQEAGALSVMSAYNSINGVPCSSDTWLLKEVLRNEWGFEGFVVSDYSSVKHLCEKHRVAASPAEAARQVIEAGLDMELVESECFEEILNLLRDGKISEEAIDEAARRILRVKFWLGLFDDPYVDPEHAEELCDCDEHRSLARKASRDSMVLLKNNCILPLDDQIRNIAVIGPNSNILQLGDYSGFGTRLVTPLEGIKNRAFYKQKVFHENGCRLSDLSREGFARARRVAARSDVALIFAGNSFDTEGEDKDRHSLDLPGVQEDLILEIARTNTPVVVILINGAPVTMMKWINDVDAVVEAWYTGEEGGHAIAEVLFGDHSPGGKLPVTFPRYADQLPLYYGYRPSGRHDDYADLRGSQALFPFGHGLSYTDFKYGNLQVTPETISPQQSLEVTFELENIGLHKGDEVVQLYITDVVSSISRPTKELRRFRRVSLDPGHKELIQFTLTHDDLAFLDSCMNPVVEPGVFIISIGSSSEDIRLKGSFEVV